MSGQDHTGLGGLRIPVLIGGTIFAWYQGIASWARVLANNPTEIIANNNNTLIVAKSGGLANPNIMLEISFGTIMLIGAAFFTVMDYFMLKHYLVKETKQE